MITTTTTASFVAVFAAGAASHQLWRTHKEASRPLKKGSIKNALASTTPMSVTAADSERRLKPVSHQPLFSTSTGIDNVIFDLGDVLFTWSAASPDSPLAPKIVKQILRSANWFEYERGNILEAEAYARAGIEFSVPAQDVARAFQLARDSLCSDTTMLNAVRELRASGKRVFAMSNISAPDWEVLKTKISEEEWSLFDRVFTSAEARERKPNIGFYRHVLLETGIDPKRTFFVDDKVENVLSARSCGLQGVVFENSNDVCRQLKNLCGDSPISRGHEFLNANRKSLKSFTSNGMTLNENFAQLLILEATGDESLVDYIQYPGQHNFFQGGGVLTTAEFPNDLDTTSIGLTVTKHLDDAAKHQVMNEMLQYRNQDGLIQVYFDHTRPRIDPIVCVNVLTLFYRHGRGHELEPTLNWVEAVLVNRAYAYGTLYYATAECFLFFLSRLVSTAPEVHRRLKPVLRDRVSELFGAPGDALALAMRIIAGASVGLVHTADYEHLLGMQDQDGVFRPGWFYKYGSSGLLIGNDGVTTALAIQAINAYQRLT